MSAHRSHAHYLAKGGDLKAMVAELYGKATGCARGKGGSMHLIDRSVGFLGCVPIVGSTIPIAVGASFGSRLLGNSATTTIFFGDGAAETGVFAETLSFAALHKLPVLFVCENNLYSVLTPQSERQPHGRRIVDVAAGLGVPGEQVDGQDVETVFDVAGQMISRIRDGGGPGFLEFLTYRYLEHCGPLDDTRLGYRPPGEFEDWLERDPVRIETERLIAEKLIDAKAIERLESELALEIDDAVEFAQASPCPERAEMDASVFA